MKTIWISVTLLFTLVFSTSILTAQAVGDYGSAGTGNWGVVGTWVVCVSPGTWAGATAASVVPASTTNVWIRSGNTVTVEVSGKLCNTLTIENGATLAGANNLPTSSLRYIRIYGSTVTNNGTIGTATDVLGLQLFGGASQVLTITGSGTTYLSRIQPQTSGQAVIFDANVQLDYAGASGTGSTSLYCANGNFTVTINAGKTVTMAPNSYISAHTSSGSSAGNANFTINVYGTLSTGYNSIINLNNTSPNVSLLTVFNNGNINLGNYLRGDAGTGTITIEVNSGGSILGTDYSTNFSLDSTIVNINGTLDFGTSEFTRRMKTGIVNGTIRLRDHGFPYGNITLSSGSIMEMYGGFQFPYAPGIEFANVIINSSSVLEAWDSIHVSGTMTMTSGYIKIKRNYVVRCNAFAGGSNSSFIFTDSTGKVIVSVAPGGSNFIPVGPNQSSYNPVTIALDGSSTADNFAVRVEEFDSAPPVPEEENIVRVVWNINEETSGGSNATLTLQWNGDQEGGFFSDPSASIWRYNGSIWDDMTGGTVNGTDPYTVSNVSPITNFSPFIIGTDIPLSVELKSFTALVKSRGVELAWKTATEVNNLGFEVERSVITPLYPPSRGDRGVLWKKIGFVEGHGTTNAPQSYTFVDASAKGTVSYRLKQIDRDGQFEYHNAVEVTVAKPAVYALDQNYPNPFNPSTAITYSVPNTGKVMLSVYDMLGKEVASLVNGVVEAGEHTAQFNASQLPSGMYFYTIRTRQTEGGQANNFTETKKMTLVK